MKNTSSGILKNILQANANTEFGRQHQFEEINDYAEFAAKLPVSDYEDLEPYIEKQIAGEKSLFSEKLAFVETTFRVHIAAQADSLQRFPEKGFQQHGQ
ncbi:MAG: GH3 auxin-responsive promoter family protein [Owenweeksia sp.]|nr:GH3 auxin-responsive promoter family protein [Owenweeksia sp.]